MDATAVTDRCLQDLLTRMTTEVLITTDTAEKRAIRTIKKKLHDRLYQRKTRAKREQHIRSLEHDVQSLNIKVEQLYRYLRRREMAMTNAGTQSRQHPQYLIGSLQDHARSIVMQFFSVYENGYSLPLARLQERFLRSIMATDVEGVSIRGIEAFVEQWRLYGQNFALCVLEPQAWKTQNIGDQSVMVEVEIMLYFRCHRQTINTLFPSLKSGQVDPELVQPLVTGTTTVMGTYTFVVDHTGYVDSLNVNLQLMETLRRVLGSLENVAQLTQDSRIELSSGIIAVV
ncbi:hypothetical protein PHMEG_00015597 [Phytophthora megakarya]|uniref:Bzip transcription factor n=1 Tax=Phytophthora megakarya TaxID=4795 RepID=A0A225W301_9STRA|nr:hypothetical protein PHMEG_00015597 [Phytophthora megakarya]